MKINLKMASGEWWIFCFGLNVWKSNRRVPSQATIYRRNIDLWYFLCSKPEPGAEQTVESPTIIDAMTLMLRYCKDTNDVWISYTKGVCHFAPVNYDEVQSKLISCLYNSSKKSWYNSCMITPSNRNIFRVIGSWWGKSQRPMVRRFDAFFDLRLNKRLSKQ